MKAGTLVVISVLGPLAGQAPFTAQWTALAPIVAQWTNAPTGTANPIATFPAGPLPNTAISVSVAVGSYANAAGFSSAPLPLASGMVMHWSFGSHAWLPANQQSSTFADLLLQISGPPGATGTLECRVGSLGDSPSPLGFRVDVGNDGSFELDSSPTWSTASQLERHAGYAWDFTSGPLTVRVLHAYSGWITPQSIGLTLAFRPWVALADSFGNDCSNQGTASWLAGYTTHYHLAALPPLVPTDLAALRATGLGWFSAFLISDQPQTITFHLPGFLSSPCDRLAHVAFTATGCASRTAYNAINAMPAEWVVPVPALPPGLVFFVQHASMQLPYLGLTNRVRIRT